MRFKGQELAKGPAALEKSFLASEISPGNHMAINVVVEVEGGSASMRSNFFYITLEKIIPSVGLYEAAFVKVGGDWKIMSWDIDVGRSAEADASLRQRPPRLGERFRRGRL